MTEDMRGNASHTPELGALHMDPESSQVEMHV